MNSSQASAPVGGARLVAVRLAGSAALAAIDRVWADDDAVLPLDPALPEHRARAIATDLGAAAIIGNSGTALGATAMRGRDPAGMHGRDPADDGPATAPPSHRAPLPSPAPVPEGTALVVRTSGSTGAPRGVVLSHAALHSSVRASLRRLGCVPGDRWLCVLPLQHVAGLLVVLRARALGTEPVIHSAFDPQAVLAERSATHVALVPTMLRRLLDHGADGDRLGHVLLGGAAAPAALLQRARVAGIVVTTTYGMTETAGGCVYDGIPLDDVAAAVDPDGRVLVAGPMLASGYRDGHAITPLTSDGWLRTNDFGYFDDARLTVTGRADDVIVTGGVNVSATAVAAVLRHDAAIEDAAVVGVDDPQWGQRVVAVVVASDPTTPPTLERVRAIVRARIDAAAAPRELVVVGALPRTVLGKVDHAAVERLGVSAG